jgi:hypothetical protein
MPQRLPIERDALGRLIWTDTDGVEHVGVNLVRAFPLSRPQADIALVDAAGHELAWFATLDELAPEDRELIEHELQGREFRPVIHRIVSVSTFATPSVWQLQTDRGPCALVLKAEEDIRRLEGPRLLITSEDGIGFEIPDRWALDRNSKRMLERFL